MSASAQHPPFEPFYLPAPCGERFCIFHPAGSYPRAAVLYLHPFAEEMNKSRRMAALQARMLAAHDIAVLQVDLFGCGDSSGEFGEARWEVWLEDVFLALRWLDRRISAPIRLWGLRLGALLALDFATRSRESISGFMLWQPVRSGEAFMNQFLRLRLATDMMAEEAERTDTQQLRREIEAGAVMEIAGYDLAPELLGAIDRLDLVELSPGGQLVDWIEVVSAAGRAFPPAAQRAANVWRDRGVNLRTSAVSGPTFWNTVEITDCPELLPETTRLIAEAPQ